MQSESYSTDVYLYISKNLVEGNLEIFIEIILVFVNI